MCNFSPLPRAVCRQIHVHFLAGSHVDKPVERRSYPRALSSSTSPPAQSWRGLQRPSGSSFPVGFKEPIVAGRALWKTGGGGADKQACRAARNQFPQWQAECYEKSLGRNGDFARPLDSRECYHVAKSVAKWTWRKDAEADV